MPSYQEATKLLYTQNDAAARRFLLGIRRLAPDEPVPDEALLSLLVCDWLATLGFLSDAQQYQIVGHFRPQLEAIVLELRGTASLPVYTLDVADYRWASLTGAQQFLDTDTFQVLDKLPDYTRVVTHFFCNLTALWLLAHEKLRLIRHACPRKDASDVSIGEARS